MTSDKPDNPQKENPPKKSLSQFFAESPLVGLDLEIVREIDPERVVELE